MITSPDPMRRTGFNWRLALLAVLSMTLTASCGSSPKEVDGGVIGDTPYGNFRNQDLRGQRLSGLILAGSDFTNAVLTGVDLAGAQLGGAIFSNATMTGASLIGADLTSADLSEAILVGADLSGVNLTSGYIDDADLTRATLTGARLVGVKMRGTDFTEATLIGADFYGSISDRETVWPEGFNLDEAGVPPLFVHPGGGGTIAFQHDADGNWDVFLMNWDGTDVRVLTDDEDYNFHPELSPDGESVVFVRGNPLSDRDGDNEIFVMDSRGDHLRQLTDNDLWDDQPAWSPDGSKIAFSRWEEDTWVVYVMDSDGSNPVALTKPEFSAMGPSWSPDGTRLVVVAFNAQAERFFVSVMDADGSDPVPLFSTAGAEPSWSPDGRYIAFQCDPEDLTATGTRICLASADGSEVHELTAPDEGSWDSMAAWSPDSSTVIFRRIARGTALVSQIQTDGTGLKSFNLPHGVFGAPGNWVN
jgi:uncharacterized protein YjbI with pentapeptide repeats